MENQTNRIEMSYEKIGNGIYRIKEGIIVNCYLVLGSKKALLIDCGMGTHDMKKIIDEITIMPVEVVCTHGHVDHIGGIREFGKFYIDYMDLPTLLFALPYKERIKWCKTHPVMKKSGIIINSMPHKNGFVKVIPFKPGKKFDLGDRTVTSHRSAGHSLGHCFFTIDDERVAFVGDNFMDYLNLALPYTSSLASWLKGLDELKKYARDCTLYSSHSSKPTEWSHLQWQEDTIKRIIGETKSNSKKAKKVLVKHDEIPHLCVCYKSNNVL